MKILITGANSNRNTSVDYTKTEAEKQPKNTKNKISKTQCF